MPRRRKITIRASELECFETLVRELQQRPEFAGFDPSSLHVWAYERYEPKLKDADAILRRFDYWLGVHKSERYLMVNGSRLFNKKELAEVLALGEPTTTALTEKPNLSPAVKPTTAVTKTRSRKK